MDRPTMKWLHDNLHPDELTSRRVLEVGSYNVNGSVAPHIKRWTGDYTGVDIAAGPGVDRVLDVHSLTAEFGHDSFDLVVSTEMLEHVEDWRNAVLQMAAVLRPNGLLVITTRAPGFVRHCHPWDFWRFTTKNLRQALGGGFRIVACQYVLGQGVVIKAQKTWPLVPRDLADIKPRPAPVKEIKDWKLRYLWAVWAYRGTPSEAYPCCPTGKREPAAVDAGGDMVEEAHEEKVRA